MSKLTNIISENTLEKAIEEITGNIIESAEIILKEMNIPKEYFDYDFQGIEGNFIFLNKNLRQEIAEKFFLEFADRNEVIKGLHYDLEDDIAENEFYGACFDLDI